jgi:long-chain acyl-CoA synthetase
VANANEQPLHAMAAAALAGGDDAPAIQFHDVWLDWGWLRGVADRLEGVLREAGVGPGDAIGFAPLNRPECAAALLGLIAAQRDVVMIYAYQSPEAIGRKITELRCAAVIAPADLWKEPARAAAIAAGALAVALDGDAVTAVAGTAVDRTVEHHPAVDKPGIALLTSGTTGAPKHFHMNYDVIGRAMVRESGVMTTHTEPDALEVQPAALHYFPFGNIAGVYSYLPLALTRRPVLMVEKFSLPAWLDYVRRWRPTTSGLPTAAFRMLLEANVPPADLASLHQMSTGAATLDPSVHREFEQRYGIPVLLSYGATEFGGIVSSMTPADQARYGAAKFGSVGRPWASAKLRIVDPDSRELLPPGRDGLIEVLSPRMGPDWIRTTDLGMIDEDGFLYHRGRSDGAIMRGGFKIVPEPVSAALAEHPSIAAAAVVGVADQRLGEVPVAAYELRTGAPKPSRDELEAHMRARLPATHLPVLYREVQALPRTPSLKFDLAAVRALFADGGEAQPKKTPER